MLEIFASTPENLGLGEIGDFARRVEAMGYDGLSYLMLSTTVCFWRARRWHRQRN